MEFIWNVEEQKLKDLDTYDVESLAMNYTTEEKIVAIDTYSDYRFKVSRQVSLRNQFIADAEKGLIKESKQWKESNGNWWYNQYNYVSLKAWLTKHDRKIYSFESYDSLSKLEGFDSWNTWKASCPLDGSDETLEKYINDLLCRMVYCYLRHEEVKWFAEHDEWTIENKKLCNRHHYGNERTNLGFWSSGDWELYGEDSESICKFKPTVEQLKTMNAFYDDIEESIEALIEEKYKNFPLKDIEGLILK
jgi:hypothetical protein